MMVECPLTLLISKSGLGFVLGIEFRENLCYSRSDALKLCQTLRCPEVLRWIDASVLDATTGRYGVGYVSGCICVLCDMVLLFPNECSAWTELYLCHAVLYVESRKEREVQPKDGSADERVCEEDHIQHGCIHVVESKDVAKEVVIVSCIIQPATAQTAVLRCVAEHVDVVNVHEWVTAPCPIPITRYSLSDLTITINSPPSHEQPTTTPDESPKYIQSSASQEELQELLTTAGCLVFNQVWYDNDVNITFYLYGIGTGYTALVILILITAH